MTDLEITRLCAEAMGYHIEKESTRSIQVRELWAAYDPLRDDAQAMALVKRCILDIDYGQGVEWTVSDQHSDFDCEGFHQVMNPDLNRAICECVAKMVDAK